MKGLGCHREDPCRLFCGLMKIPRHRMISALSHHLWYSIPALMTLIPSHSPHPSASPSTRLISPRATAVMTRVSSRWPLHPPRTPQVQARTDVVYQSQHQGIPAFLTPSSCAQRAQYFLFLFLFLHSGRTCSCPYISSFSADPSPSNRRHLLYLTSAIRAEILGKVGRETRSGVIYAAKSIYFSENKGSWDAQQAKPCVSSAVRKPFQSFHLISNTTAYFDSSPQMGRRRRIHAPRTKNQSHIRGTTYLEARIGNDDPRV